MISNDGVLNYDIFPSGVSLYLAMTFGFSPYLAVSLAKKKNENTTSILIEIFLTGFFATNHFLTLLCNDNYSYNHTGLQNSVTFSPLRKLWFIYCFEFEMLRFDLM